MLPIHGRGISGSTSELQDRAQFHATVKEIRTDGEGRVNPVRRAKPNSSADHVKQETIDPHARGDRSGQQGAISYDAVAQALQEEEHARQESRALEQESQKEAIAHNPPLTTGLTSPGVIVSRGGASRIVAKLFIQAASNSSFSTHSTTPSSRESNVRVDVTI
ncbi:MAG: hypothetical protein HQL72_05995 [Magnetococcales bacterium]|nr:hypothetical protein [Magnetococcales bacterium]